MSSETSRDLAKIAQTYAIAIGLSLFFALFYVPSSTNETLPPVWLMGLSFGIPFGTVIVLIHMTRLGGIRFHSYLLTILYRAALHIVGLWLSFYCALAMTIGFVLKTGPLHPTVFRSVGRLVTTSFVASTGVIMLTLTLIFAVGHAISRKLGPGVLWNWLRGYYHVPREEERIFMFLDMKDSTTLAERLGHLKFSELVRDFMADLTEPILTTRGEVSHYIGDEAVLTWRMDRGLAQANCIRCAFLMREQISKRAAHYEREYGLVPEFKAGVHCGKVVVTEVGEVKSELVYHGDVLNTTARIQGLCNGFGARLLVSDELWNRLPEAGRTGEDFGEQVLKGRVEPVRVWSVSGLG